MYEKHHEPLISRNAFYKRLLIHFSISSGFIFVSLGVGVLGLKHLEGLSIHDAFLHSAILLGGLGLVETPATTSGKWFMGLYGLYSGLVFLVAAGIVIAPAIHRLLHAFYWDKQEDI